MCFHLCFCFFDWYSNQNYKFCKWIKNTITAGIKKYKSIIINRKRKSKLNSIEVLISKALINSVISHDEFVLINKVLNKYNEMEDLIKKCKHLIRFIKYFSLFIKQCYCIVKSVEKIQKVYIKKLQGQKTEE